MTQRKNLFATREQWLQAFVKVARPHFAANGSPIPERVRIGIGFTSKGKRGKRIGECWASVCSSDQTSEIFVVPSIGDGARVADIVTHELVHAAVGLDAGHKAPFATLAKALGLEGKMTATVAGPGWHAWADPILERLGPYPHAGLHSGASSAAPKQTTRMLLARCDCGYQVRLTRKWAQVGLPICPVCEVGLRCDAVGVSEGVRLERAA